MLKKKIAEYSIHKINKEVYNLFLTNKLVILLFILFHSFNIICFVYTIHIVIIIL